MQRHQLGNFEPRLTFTSKRVTAWIEVTAEALMPNSSFCLLFSHMHSQIFPGIRTCHLAGCAHWSRDGTPGGMSGAKLPHLAATFSQNVMSLYEFQALTVNIAACASLPRLLRLWLLVTLLRRLRTWTPSEAVSALLSARRRQAAKLACTAGFRRDNQKKQNWKTLQQLGKSWKEPPNHSTHHPNVTEISPRKCHSIKLSLVRLIGGTKSSDPLTYITINGTEMTCWPWWCRADAWAPGVSHSPRAPRRWVPAMKPWPRRPPRPSHQWQPPAEVGDVFKYGEVACRYVDFVRFLWFFSSAYQDYMLPIQCPLRSSGCIVICHQSNSNVWLKDFNDL